MVGRQTNATLFLLFNLAQCATFTYESLNILFTHSPHVCRLAEKTKKKNPKSKKKKKKVGMTAKGNKILKIYNT